MVKCLFTKKKHRIEEEEEEEEEEERSINPHSDNFFFIYKGN